MVRKNKEENAITHNPFIHVKKSCFYVLNVVLVN